MQAVILTGGLGTRLRPLTSKIPKGLVEVGGRPFLEYILLNLRKFQIRDIILCTGYRGEMIRNHFGDGSGRGLTITYSQEDQPLGTGGALKRALPLLRETFILLNGDTLLLSDYRKMEAAFRFFSGLMLLSAFPVEGTSLSPNLRLEAGGRIKAYDRSNSGGRCTHVDAGSSLVRKKLADYFPPGDRFSLEEEVYPRLTESGLMGAWPVGEQFYDIGTPFGLQRLREFLKPPPPEFEWYETEST